MERVAPKPLERRRTPGRLGAVRRAPGVSAALALPVDPAPGPAPPEAPPEEVDMTASSRLEMTPRAGCALEDDVFECDLDNDGDDWLDRELAAEAEKRASARKARRTKRRETESVPSAATQIVNRAISRFMGSENAAEPPIESSAASFRQETNSILDKGLEAINNVSRLMEGFAVTLDNVIEKAFEDWGASSMLKTADPAALKELETPLPPEIPQTAKALTAGRDQGDEEPSTIGQDENEPPEEEMTDREAEKWRRQALKLRRELAQLKAKQRQLQSIEAQEQRLRREQIQLERSPAMQPDERSDVDREAVEQVTEQLQVLLTEKAKLAQDNARLVRENTGLQELLEFTMAQRGGPVDEEFPEGLDE